MPIKKSFFVSSSDAPLIILIGHFGKTIVKTLLECIFQKEILQDSTFEKEHRIEEIISLSNRAQLEKKPFLADFHVEYLRNKEEQLSQLKPKIIAVTSLNKEVNTKDYSKPSLTDLVKHFLLMQSDDTIILLNQDDDDISIIAETLHKKTVVKFGFNTNADFFATHIKQLGTQGLSFIMNNTYHLEIRIFQLNYIYNILIAIIIGRLFQLDIKKIFNRLEKNYSVPSGRCSLERIGFFNILNDTHNHTFQNVVTSAKTLVTFKKDSNKMIMVLGDIDTNLDDKRKTHLNIGHFLSPLPIDVIITFGHYATHIHEGIELIPNHRRIILHTNSVDELVSSLQLILEKNDTILLKATQETGITRFIHLLKKNIYLGVQKK